MRTAAFVLTAAVLLSGCAVVPAMTAQDDARRFLLAVRNNDQATFDAIVDQKALATSVASARCLRTVDRSVPGAGSAPLFACIKASTAQMAPIPLSAFRGIAASFGYERGRRPTQAVRIQTSRNTNDQVCVRNKLFGPCILRFIGHGDNWRLTAVDDPAQLEGL